MVSTVFSSLGIFTENGKNLTSLGLHSHMATTSGSMWWPWRCDLLASPLLIVLSFLLLLQFNRWHRYIFFKMSSTLRCPIILCTAKTEKKVGVTMIHH